MIGRNYDNWIRYIIDWLLPFQCDELESFEAKGKQKAHCSLPGITVFVSHECILIESTLEV